MDNLTYDIRKNMLTEFFNDTSYKPMKLKELSMFFHVPKEEREELKMMLDRMISEGKLILTGDGRYSKPEPTELIGTFSGTTRGFGFVVVEGRKDDIFISGDYTMGALHGDTVAVKITKQQAGDKRCEGHVARIVSRANETIIGTFDKSKNYGFVIPDNAKLSQDVFVRNENAKGAVSGHKVVAKIIDYGSKHRNPEGVIVEIIGHIDDPQTDILSVIKAYNIPTDFSEDVIHELKSVPDVPNAEDMKGRLDLRHLYTVTIDGEDAKDLDDAITLEKDGDIYHLGVHIADVSHYVRENSPLDKEAKKRGTSVYLVDRVIPMLPHQLSNGICSLNAGCDRLALSCLMDIDSKGNVLGHQIAETVICVDQRMTYTAVNAIINDLDSDVINTYKESMDFFKLMKEAADVLRGKRRVRGGIDFDFPESKIILDKKGYPVDVHPYERNDATKIIEDFMLIANETIAEDFFWQELPFVYRTHETPDLERIQKLTAIIRNFGYYMKVGREEIHPKEFQKLLGKIQDTPEEAMISRLALRSMKQARYTTENSGHFGLAVKYYCHFTSPIRRYPDLQIHRIIKDNLCGRLDEKRQEHYHHILNEVAEHSSKTERRAEEAERDVEKLKKVEYMSQFIGDEFEGVISGMTNWGMYVELPNTCEGMIRLSDLDDDYYYYDEEAFAIIGETSGMTYRLGQKIKVYVESTDKMSRTIDFVPAYDD